MVLGELGGGSRVRWGGREVCKQIHKRRFKFWHVFILPQLFRSLQGASHTTPARHHDIMSGTAAIFQKAGLVYEDHHFKDAQVRRVCARA